MLRAALLEAGVPAQAIDVIPDEQEAVERGAPHGAAGRPGAALRRRAHPHLEPGRSLPAREPDRRAGRAPVRRPSRSQTAELDLDDGQRPDSRRARRAARARDRSHGLTRADAAVAARRAAAPMRILDSRRLTGPNLLLDGPGAILDVALEGLDSGARAIAALAAALRSAARAARDGALRRSPPRAHARGARASRSRAARRALRRHRGQRGGVARRGARARQRDGRSAETARGGDRRDAARGIEAEERKPWLARARARGRAPRRHLPRRRPARLGGARGRLARLAARGDSATCSTRFPGTASTTSPSRSSPAPTARPRRCACSARWRAAAGRTAGVTSTDRVDGRRRGRGGSATTRDPTARAPCCAIAASRSRCSRSRAAASCAAASRVPRAPRRRSSRTSPTTISASSASSTCDALADAKMVVAKAIGPGGRVVLNADDPLLVERERGLRRSAGDLVHARSAAPGGRARTSRAGGDACVLDGDALVARAGRRASCVARAGRRADRVRRRRAPQRRERARGDRRRRAALGLPLEAIARALRGFDERRRAANPGRANVWTLGGVTAIVDFAHNPHGLEALAALAARDARRAPRDRDRPGGRPRRRIDRQLAACAATLRPDRVFIKEMEIYLRGREPGAVPALIERELRRSGSLVRLAARLGAGRRARRARLGTRGGSAAAHDARRARRGHEPDGGARGVVLAPGDGGRSTRLLKDDCGRLKQDFPVDSLRRVDTQLFSHPLVRVALGCASRRWRQEFPRDDIQLGVMLARVPFHEALSAPKTRRDTKRVLRRSAPVDRPRRGVRREVLLRSHLTDRELLWT